MLDNNHKMRINSAFIVAVAAHIVTTEDQNSLQAEMNVFMVTVEQRGQNKDAGKNQNQRRDRCQDLRLKTENPLTFCANLSGSIHTLWLICSFDTSAGEPVPQVNGRSQSQPPHKPKKSQKIE